MVIVRNEDAFAAALAAKEPVIAIGSTISFFNGYKINYDVTINGYSSAKKVSFEAPNYGWAIEGGATVRIQDNLKLYRGNTTGPILRVTGGKCILNSIQIEEFRDEAIVVGLSGILEVEGNVEINQTTGEGICCQGGSVLLKDAAESGKISNKLHIAYGTVSIEGKQRIAGMHMTSSSTVPAITGALPSGTNIQVLEAGHIRKDNLPVTIAKSSGSYPVLTQADANAFVPPATFATGRVYPNATNDAILLDNGFTVNEASISLVRIG